MAVLALCLFASFRLPAGVARILIQWRRTGDPGIRRDRAAGPAQQWARATLVTGVLAVLGIAAVIGAQSAMGASWRDDVDPAERTTLIIHGPFRLVRNPIYTAALTWALGLAQLVPNPLALPGPLLLLLGLELQVRRVEEPYLRRVHGVAYQQYAARVGRLLPGTGRLQG
ncbi:methyltransferase family protein [Streptomyces cyaneofuscatus]|uniref:methyltransferase family protein n=1 Tax=Streptomyces cyaneofuscatus TaxID=66883 RepID=UPI0037B23F6B